MADDTAERLAVLIAAAKWLQWRQGQCDWPKGVNAPEHALAAAVEALTDSVANEALGLDGSKPGLYRDIGGTLRCEACDRPSGRYHACPYC